MIVATAGHVDHGKTSLVRALTGVDTDRLPQEKTRGISIDLGFAYAATSSGRSIGFVDVPGHERFIRNMLAGVCGIDAVLLVVAADDGVMPQTREHLAIVDLLGVAHGVIAISKVDCVSRQRIDEVRGDVRDAIAATALADASMIEVSSVTGQGVEALRQWLDRAAETHVRTHVEGQGFRYVIDRAFTAPGSGTVVTGTVLQGAVKAGDHVQVTPSGAGARIRGIQKNGVSCTEASVGERCALNVVGVEREQVGRGRWLACEDASTTRASVRLHVLAGAPHPLRHMSRIHLHVGTANVAARIAAPKGAAIEPGSTVLVDLYCDTPISVVVGDRFIARDASATHTLGGGVVLDPFAPSRRVSHDDRTARLEALGTLDAPTALASLLGSCKDGVDVIEFGRAFNLTPTARDAIVAGLGAQLVGTRALSGERMREFKSALMGEVQRFHERTPQVQGIELTALRATVARGMTQAHFAAVVRDVAAECGIEIVGSHARCAGHVSTANRQDQVLWQRAKPRLMEAGFRGMAVTDLAATLRIPEVMLRDFLHRKASVGDVVRVSPKRFYPREVMAGLAEIATSLAAQSPQQSFIAAEFRDASGVNRTLAIEILECLDRMGITQRVGDARKIRKEYVTVLGPATVRNNAVHGRQTASSRASNVVLHARTKH